MATQAAIYEAFDPGHFNLILFSTERCNFRCTYCYERFDHGRMRPQVVAGVKKLIDRRAEDLRTLEISWFGGEPLLASELVVEVARHAKVQAQKQGFAYTGNMTTNGFRLDLQTAAQLVETGTTAFHISLDGPAGIHDRTRRRADGSETFSRIWQNLIELRESDLSVEVLLRVHATPENRPHLVALVDQLNEAFARDSRFKVYFKRIGRLGGPDDASMEVLNPAEEGDLADFLQARLSPGLREDAPSPSNYVCYAARPNSLAIRADGSVAKCTVALYDPRNRIGELRPDGTLLLDQAKLKPWMRGFSSGRSEELACPLSTMPA
jgi:uncharacterized protein